MSVNNTHQAQIKINVTIETFACLMWFGKKDTKGKEIDEERYRAVATVYGQEIASTEYIFKNEKAALAAVKCDITQENV